MSSSYSPNAGPSSGQSWSSDIFSQEKKVFRNNIPLVISTTLATAIYSYTMIDKSTNNAINRALIMALSTFISASVVNMLEDNDYLDKASATPRYVEGALIPLVYYFVTKQQFQLPDLQSQAIKTGVIAAVIGEFANPTVTQYYDKWDNPTQNTTLSPGEMHGIPQHPVNGLVY